MRLPKTDCNFEIGIKKVAMLTRRKITIKYKYLHIINKPISTFLEINFVPSGENCAKLQNMHCSKVCTMFYSMK